MTVSRVRSRSTVQRCLADRQERRERRDEMIRSGEGAPALAADPLTAVESTAGVIFRGKTPQNDHSETVLKLLKICSQNLENQP